MTFISRIRWLYPAIPQTPRSFAKARNPIPSLSQRPTLRHQPLPPNLPTPPPPLRTPKPDQTLPADPIPALQQRRYVDIERTIHLRIRQQLMYSLQGRRERVCRRPRRFEQIEADFAGFEIHVGVADGGCEGDFGRGERVGGRDEDVEAPETG